MTSENTQIQKYDETLQSVSGTLLTLSETLPEDLAVRVQNLAAKTSPFVKGIEAPQRVKIPNILLRQASSNSPKLPEETAVGQLYTTQSEHLGDSFNFIPVYTHNVRKKWGSDDKIECMAMDGLVGSVYGACKQCPYGQYVPNQKPQCSPGAMYYVVTEDLQSIYAIDFSKTSAPAGKTIRQLSLPPNMWSRVFTLSVDKQTKGKNTYYVLKTSATPKRTDAQTSAVCDALYEFFHSNYKKTLLLRDEYAKKKASGDTTAVGETTVMGNEEEFNFKDTV